MQKGSTRKRTLVSILMLLFTISIFSVFMSGKVAAAPSDYESERYSKLDSYLKSNLNKHLIPRMSISVFDEDNNSFVKTYESNPSSLSNSEKNSRSYMIASISKTFTSVAIMQLREQGDLSLDDKVQNYVPYFEMKPVAWAQNLTIDHLLTHTSGIPAAIGDKSYPESWTKEELIRNIRDKPLKTKPGTYHEYCNTNFLILGQIIEEITGESYEGYVKREIFDPLNMTQSFTNHKAAESAGDLVQGHEMLFGIWYAQDSKHPNYGIPAGGLVVSPLDFNKYIQMLLNSGLSSTNNRILTASSVEKMFSLPSGLSSDSPLEYARGWYNQTIEGRKVVRHGGDLPNFAGEMVLLPELNLGFSIQFNVNSFVSNVFTYFEMVDNVVSILVGEPIEQSWLNLRAFYIILDILIAFSVALGIRKQVKLGSRVEQSYQKLEDPAKFRKKQGLKAIINLSFTLFLTLGVPAIVGSLIGRPDLAFSVMWLVQKDLVLWLGFASASNLVFAVRRLIEMHKRREYEQKN